MALTLLEKVGAGAHGEVWRATWGGRTVAAKLLDARDALDEAVALADAAALRAEGQHAFIGLEEVTQVQGRWALVLEWVEGQTVGEVLASQGPASSKAVETLLSSGCSALAAAWGSGETPLRLIHRDLKPANLMVDGRGQLRIADLGLATRWVRPGRAAVGTPGYVAPERYLGEDGVASDVYGMGCVAYEMLTGRGLGQPGGHARGHARKIRAARADLVERQTPPALIDTIAAMLCFDPSDRPSHDAVASACVVHPASLRSWSRPSWFQRTLASFPLFNTRSTPCAQQ